MDFRKAVGEKLQTVKQAAVYSGADSLPVGTAAPDVLEGCMVLEGGAFRGVYTSGVLDALMEGGVNLSCTVGVSAGAMNGMNYVSGQIGRSANINLRFRHDSRYVGLQAVRHNQGLIGFDFVFGHMDGVPELDEARFMQQNRKFYAVVTDLASAKPVYIEKESRLSIYQAVRASASMPYISRPVRLGKHRCLDGGCSVNIPYQFALHHGYDKIVIIKTRENGFRKEIAENRRVHSESLFYRSYPEFAAALADADARYNRECDAVDALAESGRACVIAPSEPVTVSRLEPDMEKLGALYYLGYHDGQAALPRVKAYLGA